MEDQPGTETSPGGDGGERIARNGDIFRQANERIRAAAEEHAFPGRVPFVCECADTRCREILRLTLDEYAGVRSDPRQFVNAPGHEASAEGWGKVVARRDRYVVVADSGIEPGEPADDEAGAGSVGPERG